MHPAIVIIVLVVIVAIVVLVRRSGAASPDAAKAESPTRRADDGGFRPPAADFHVSGGDAHVFFDVPLPDGDPDPVLSLDHEYVEPRDPDPAGTQVGAQKSRGPHTLSVLSCTFAQHWELQSTPHGFG